MNYLKFNKQELINLEYSLSREILRSNWAGAYASYTLVGCNTRKYHGLLVCPLEKFNGEQHVLLSGLDLSVIYNSGEFNLGLHKYEGDIYNPKGHKYVQDFKADNTPQIYYRIGGVRIVQESFLVEYEQQILIRYTILEADMPIKLKFTPFLAYRNIHQLGKANLHVNTKISNVDNGIKTSMYNGFPYLNMQFSKNVEFIQVPDWYYNVEYSEEQKRGYAYQEDLYVPGFFETTAKKGESIVFSASTKAVLPKNLKPQFTKGIGNRIPRDSFKNCLRNSADQFIVKKGNALEIKAGYHWIGSRSRDTFISLPGLCLTKDDKKDFLKIIDTQISRLENGLFPSKQANGQFAYNSPDASLWFFWALQQYKIKYGNAKQIWKSYGKVMKSILSAYKTGSSGLIELTDNGLIHASGIGMALTWMDAVYLGKPVTPRSGYTVEVNALWYNAICFSLELAEKSNDASFIRSWKKWPKIIADSFIDTFWDNEKMYLADFTENGKVDWNIRPNQIIAAALPYSPLTTEMKNSVLDIVRQHLLTPRGLRSLAPRNPAYIGIYEGSQEQRDNAYHQGAVWPWLLEHYCETYLDIHKYAGLGHIKKIIDDFEPSILEHGLGTISEIYDGDPPHAPKGAISQAWSVAALLRIIEKIESMEST
jgi:predicted glycogen debranching enzyme